MKKLRFKFLALLMITSVAFLSCKKEDRFAPMNANGSDAMSSKPIVNHADWKITLFKINGMNETKNYNGYLFEFADRGLLKAIIKDEVIFGSWGVGLRNNPGTFRISFLSEPLSNLSNSEWHIRSRTSNDLTLEYINKKNGHVAYLTFQRPNQLMDTGLDLGSPN